MQHIITMDTATLEAMSEYLHALSMTGHLPTVGPVLNGVRAIDDAMVAKEDDDDDPQMSHFASDATEKDQIVVALWRTFSYELLATALVEIGFGSGEELYMFLTEEQDFSIGDAHRLVELLQRIK